MDILEKDERLNAGLLAEAQMGWTETWHLPTGELQVKESVGDAKAFSSLICEQHQRNTRLWHEEDKARDSEADDKIIANVKRRIDRLNQERNDLVEKVDEAIFEVVKDAVTSTELPWNTETPGTVIDRLSILSLKIYHMGAQSEREDVSESHRATCKGKQEILCQQREDLKQALDVLLTDLYTGRREMKLYRQFKMYNDPTMNPYLKKGKTDTEEE